MGWFEGGGGGTVKWKSPFIFLTPDPILVTICIVHQRATGQDLGTGGPKENEYEVLPRLEALQI